MYYVIALLGIRLRMLEFASVRVFNMPVYVPRLILCHVAADVAVQCRILFLLTCSLRAWASLLLR